MGKKPSTIDHRPSTITSLLIANRGEIASRIIRTCRKMGIRSIAVFSDADKDAPFVQEADVAIYIGESAPSASYLDAGKILAAAKSAGADAIHPGYGFLSEQAEFARKCAAEGIIFIGPNPEAIEAMGSKSKAKSLMEKHTVPVVPGYQGADQKSETLIEAAKKIGFPVLLKATAGGGGKGMRIVHKEKDLEKGIAAAQRESKNAFGDDELIIEKYISSGRHIEFQIFGDRHGNAIHLLERECTIQRRYQKVIEESPSPVMDEALRLKMGEAAVNAAKALKYDNAGTVEFIYDDASGEFFFLEVNTRLQVEHPVTEEVTGLDLVQMQIESAQGLPLRLQQDDVKGSGYAIECRLYAEDPANDFLPVTGTIQRFDWPTVDGLRMETAIRSGSAISMYYDPMIAKVIVHDETRAGAHRKMLYVLEHMVCQGTTTNQAFLRHLLQHADVRKGDYNTHFIQNKIDLASFGRPSREALDHAAIAVCLEGWRKREAGRTLLRSMPSGWRNSFNDHQQERYQFGDETIELKYRYLNGSFTFLIDDRTYEVMIGEATNEALKLRIGSTLHTFQVSGNGAHRYVHQTGSGNLALEELPRFPDKAAGKEKGGYEAPMPSQIIKVLVKEGQKVKAGDGLIVLSSMKMENTIEASEDGVVGEVYAAEGASVEAGFLLLKLETNKSKN